MQKTGTIILSYILLELSLLITFHKGWFSFSCLGVQLCLITRSAFYRQWVFGEHSSLSTIHSLFKTGLTICQTVFHTDWYHEVLRLLYCHGVILHSPMVHTKLTNFFNMKKMFLKQRQNLLTQVLFLQQADILIHFFKCQQVKR